VAGWLVVVPGPLMFDAHLSSVRAFADRAVWAAPRGGLLMFRVSDRSVVYAHLAYASPVVVPEFDEPSAVAELARVGPVWVVASEDDLAALETAVRTEEVLDRVASDDRGEAPILLVRCVRPE
jgi:hypothetical protein